MHSDELKNLIIETLSELKGNNIISMDVTELTSVTDHMIIACGTSDRHVKSLAENLIDKCKKQGIRPLGTEGVKSSEWVLVDLGDVVAHIMLPATRQFYNLERLWDIKNVAREYS
ncbi:MAG: ribosome silencing factor [Candidatus Endonucleobacter bathymodioli]|uniref:Ribosomal silencing factor RsfS n=1 Tax=Candidatus Endonucleibacter bathymodioli TaxID=539814 RepID=A0AA90NM93_9GAMM|nr:ribosome silencing factor [Candidatus Endonucleobacter bathymodioli]